MPDAAFALVFEQDDKVVRKFPHHDAQGRLDPAHVRNANARIPQSDLTAEQKEQAMRHLARHKKQMGIGMAAEEAKLLEQAGEEPQRIEFEVSPEPTMDELIESVENVLEHLNEAIETLTARVERLEKAVAGKTGSGGNAAEGFLKNPKPTIPVEDAIKMIQNALPSPVVERSWGFGPQRLCQELRGVVLKLRERVKQNGQPR